MSYDKTREFDLEEVAEAMEKAKTTGEREYYERIMYRLLNESDDIKYWRHHLLAAVRAGDQRRKKYCLLRIQEIRLDETNGASWGNNKGNRMVN